jgi:lipopolysaccharide/colanic/teichoic acid biosynthesis glycosyltransferase
MSITEHGVRFVPSLFETTPAGRAVPRSWFVAKRTFDIVFSVGAIVATSPVALLAIVGICVVSPGNPFFAQERVGRNGRRFRIFKLRTMVEGAHLHHAELKHLSEVDGPVFKIKRDPRLHALGAFLRRTSIDELPNFVNVLLGHIAIVGPRPPLPTEVEHYDLFAMRRLTMKPGITCLWQISGRSNLTFQQWMELDNKYIDSWTPLGDLGIVARTVPAVLRGIGAH